jgi:hypothetical protein
MKYLIILTMTVLLSGCGDDCREIVSFLGNSTQYNALICYSPSKLKIVEKEQGIIAMCQCPKNTPKLDDAGSE